MRAASLVVLFAVACGPAQKAPVIVAPPPRDLGPEELGPVPPELRRVETDAYVVEVEAPPSAAVKQPVQARVVIKAKPGLAISTDEWRLETGVPRDMDVDKAVMNRAAALVAGDTMTYVVTVVPLRAGVRHVTFKLDGTVCDADFCDVVGDLMSWNLEVR